MARWINISVFLLCLLFAGPVRSRAEAPSVFRVDARGKTGWQIGQTLGTLIKAEFPDIEAKLDSYLADYIGLMAANYGISSQELFNAYAVPRVAAIKPAVAPKHIDEVEALASLLVTSSSDILGDGAISQNEMWTLQLAPDIARMTNCSGFGVFGEASASGSPVVGGNLDWYTTGSLRSIQAITVYRYEGIRLVNIGFAGFAGIITGFNSAGLFAGILDSPMGYTYPNPSGKRSYVFDLRTALETSTTISGAAGLLFDRQYTYSHNILFADVTDVQVLEHPQGANGTLRTAVSPLHYDISWGKSGQIAVVNFFVLSGWMNERYPFNQIRWQRLKDLAGFDPGSKAGVNDIQSIMLDTANVPNSIFNSSTVQSMVFTPATSKLYLYTIPVSGMHPPEPAMAEMKNLLELVGDINGDDAVDLTDAVLALKFLCGENGMGVQIPPFADVDGDGNIGLPEAVFALRTVAGL